MKAVQRRKQILSYLCGQKTPTSAAALAARFSVSRQIIVGDVALLRAGGAEISATPRGYLYTPERSGLLRQVACCHKQEDMARELEICVDNGCSVLDVIVEHPVYGQLTGQLQLNSRYDIEQFVQAVQSEGAHVLSELTDGIHLHTLRCPDQAAYERVCQALDAAGFLVKNQD